MNVWAGKVTMLLAIGALIVIRTPHGNRSKQTPVAKSYRGMLEMVLMTLVVIATMILPILWIATPLFSFAEYPLRAPWFGLGVACLGAGLWLFYRSHADLGTNWSPSFDIRENHNLVTSGVYRKIRHPMYAAVFLYSIGQALVAPNWIAGPSKLCAFTLMFFLRIGPEERMMLERFGSKYAAYRQTSRRLIPGVW